MNFQEPTIDYAGIAPIIALTVGLCVVLLSAVFKPTKRMAPGLTTIVLAIAAGLLIWQWDDPKTLVAGALHLVTFFVALEILSIPLYILCATNLRREGSLESGLKYLIVGSIGSATLLYGMAFLYG